MAKQQSKPIPNTGYISFKWDDAKKKFTIGGDWIDANGQRFELGFASVVRSSAIPGAIAMVAEELRHAIAGHGVKSTYNGGRRNGE